MKYELKTFFGDIMIKLTNEANDWLRLRPGIKCISISSFYSNGTGTYYITILYEK
jgi:hypothetical protein